MIAVSRFDSRACDIGSIILRVVIVVLEHPQDIVELCPRYEHEPHPMVDHAARASSFLAGFAPRALLQLYFAPFQLSISSFASRFGQRIDPQQVRATF